MLDTKSNEVNKKTVFDPEASKRLALMIKKTDKDEISEKRSQKSWKGNARMEKKFSKAVKEAITNLSNSKADGFEFVRVLTDILFQSVKRTTNQNPNSAIDAFEVLLQRVRQVYITESVEKSQRMTTILVDHVCDLCRILQFKMKVKYINQASKKKTLFPVLHGRKGMLLPKSKKFLKALGTGEDVSFSYDPINRRNSPDLEDEVVQLYGELYAAGIEVHGINKGNCDDYWHIIKQQLIPFIFLDLDAAYRVHQANSHAKQKTSIQLEKYKSKAEEYYVRHLERTFKSMALNIEDLPPAQTKPLTDSAKAEVVVKLKSYIRWWNFDCAGVQKSRVYISRRPRKKPRLEEKGKGRTRNKRRKPYERRGQVLAKPSDS